MLKALFKVRVAVFLAGLLPFGYFVYLMINPLALGADPAKALVDLSGEVALCALALALAVTPVRLITGLKFLATYRRMSGLYAFFYALIHAVFYTVFLLQLEFSRVASEVINRPYILVGAAALLCFIPLVATSTKASRRKLGRRWVKLHKLVFVIAALALIHLIWLKKLGVSDPLAFQFIVIFATLIGFRVAHALYKRIKRRLVNPAP